MAKLTDLRGLQPQGSGRPPRFSRGSGESTAPRRGSTSSVAQLRPRERQLVMLLIAGDSVKEGAARLGLSVRTAEAYLDRVKRRFGYTRLIPFIAYLVKHGLVE